MKRSARLAPRLAPRPAPRPAPRLAPWLAWCLLGCLAGCLTLGVAAPAAAYSAGLNAVKARYPTATAVQHCGVCHTSASQPFPTTGSPPRSINVYGTAWKQRLMALGVIVGQQSQAQGIAALADIEAVDSDSDGASNGAELNTGAGYLPGDASSTPPGGDTQAPSAPAVLTPIDVGTRRVNLRWLPSSDDVGVVRYEIYRAASVGGTLSAVAEVPGDVTRYSDLTPGAGDRYVYQVRAFDAAGHGTSSLSAVAEMVKAPPPLSLAYVPNAGSGTVSVLDVAGRTTVATVAVGTTPWGVAVAPDARRVFVSNADSRSVSVIDSDTQQVLATVAVGRGPRGLAATPDGRWVYVANHDDDTVSVIDTLTLAVVQTIGVGSRPYGVAVHPDNGRVYVSNSGSATVSVLQQGSNSVVDTIGTSAVPWALATSHDGTRLYVTHFVAGGAGSLDLVSTAQAVVVDTVAGLSQPGAVAVSADDAQVYVTHFETGEVSTIKALGFELEAHRFVGANAGALTVDPDTGHLLVVNHGAGTVSEVPLAGGSLQAPQAVATVGSQPLGLGHFVAAVSAVTSVSDATRLLDWAEMAYADLLQPQPSDAVNRIWGSYLYRHYPKSGSIIGVRHGRAYLLGPASGNQIQDVGSVEGLLQRAVQAGY
jgi:YVTN family beta-propeller protein